MRTSNILVITIVLLLISKNSRAQEFWELLNFPDSITIHCMDANSEGHLFIGVGNSNEVGGVYRSMDIGVSWDCVLNTGSFSVLSLEIDDNDNIYCGMNGLDKFLVSTNNGEVWAPVPLPEDSEGNIVKIFCMSTDTILISSWENFGSYIAITLDSGQSWQSSFITNKSNEYISDIDVSKSGEIYVSVCGFNVDQGGVYKSTDWGESWDYVGLLNHQVLALEINSNGDIFTGDWWVLNGEYPGIYARFKGSDEFELILPGGEFTDIAITSDDHLYVSAGVKIFYSFNHGEDFYAINEPVSYYLDYLMIDCFDHIYAGSNSTIVRSNNPIVTGSNDLLFYTHKPLKGYSIYPNPVKKGFKICINNENPLNYRERRIYIFNTFGAVVYQNFSSINWKTYYHDISYLNKGIYYLYIENNNSLIPILKL